MCVVATLLVQIAILMGCAVLPHLRQMVEIVEHGLVDEQQKVRKLGRSVLFLFFAFMVGGCCFC